MLGRILAAVLIIVVSFPARAAIWEWPLGPYGTLRLELPTGWTPSCKDPTRPPAVRSR